MHRRTFHLYAGLGLAGLLSDAQAASAAKLPVVNVKQYGALGNGITDDYLALQRAFAQINKQRTGVLYFPPGVYRIGVHKVSDGQFANKVTDLTLSNCTNVSIAGQNAQIVCDGGWVRTADWEYEGFSYSYHDSVGLMFTSCKNLSIDGLTLDGGAGTITKQATAEGASCGISLSGCYKVALTNVNLHHCCTDGLYVQEAGEINNFKVTQYLTVTNCVFDRNARQGVSIIQLRYATFRNCTFSNTGDTGLYGSHSPAAGVDIEPNYRHDDPSGTSKGDHSTGNITFDSCRFVDNEGFEFVATDKYSTQNPVQLSNCLFKNSKKADAAVVPAAANITFTGCYFDEVALWPSYTYSEDATLTKVSKCQFNSSQSAQAVLLMVGDTPNVQVSGCQFKLDAPSSHTWYRLFLRGKRITFSGNTVAISGKEEDKQNFDIVAILETQKLSNNTFFADAPSNMYIAAAKTGVTGNKLKNLFLYR